jgi:hypothetical protein
MARTTQTKKKPQDPILLPEGRLTNNALFERDQFNEKAKPMYKIEVAISKDDEKGVDALIDKLYAYADDNGLLKKDEKFDVDGGKIISGLIDGDTIAAKRERNGKPADAYKDHWVIRASTAFNKHGNEGEGGAPVYDENAEAVEAVNQQVVYNGCYGIGAVTIKHYTDDDTGLPAFGFYLAGFQKTKDGEKFASARDMSTVFKPLGKPAGAEGGRRRR